ncbi:hypothetical protein WR25_11172 [Diploscapter pachys]|uniref:Uncharacterized protein n=1 Tax=Diploscapter pachys TaxID=2018661 RepID=A0A2A2KB70_9BILA|nr:hypothetical protein WR25_11172 [Diploscapter pachys]
MGAVAAPALLAQQHLDPGTLPFQHLAAKMQHQSLDFGERQCGIFRPHQHLRIAPAIHVRATENHRHPLARLTPTLLHQCSQGGGAGTFGGVVGGFVVEAHGFGDRLVAHPHDACSMLAYQGKGVGMRHAAGHAVGEGGHATHQFRMERGNHGKAPRIGQARRLFPGHVEVHAILHQLRAQGAHGCVLLP